VFDKTLTTKRNTRSPLGFVSVSELCGGFSKNPERWDDLRGKNAAGWRTLQTPFDIESKKSISRTDTNV